jgi:hypothetical protein
MASLRDSGVSILKCKRCGYVWEPRRKELPQVCPNCKSPYWNKDYGLHAQLLIAVAAAHSLFEDELKNFINIPKAEMFGVFRKVISECTTCHNIPSLFITSQQLPVCELHWLVMVEMDIEWSVQCKRVRTSNY